MIRVALADDQVLLRETLSLVLSSNGGIEVAGVAGDGEEILEICRRQCPDVVLLDIRMPVKDGMLALEAIKAEMPGIKVIMLTTFGDERSVAEAFDRGADGYVLKDIRPQALADAIRCVGNGLFVMQDEIASLIRKRTRLSPLRRREPVAAREAQLRDEFGFDQTDRQIIRLLVEGKSNREIGETLNYSEGSIKNRITRILDATGLKDRTQIAVFALQNDII